MNGKKKKTPSYAAIMLLAAAFAACLLSHCAVEQHVEGGLPALEPVPRMPAP